jgi:hypothetical protein
MVQLVLDRMSMLIQSDRTHTVGPYAYGRSGPYAYGPNTRMIWNIYDISYIYVRDKEN